MGDIKTPYLAVDVIIRLQGGIVLVERGNFPFGWALPGGFVEIGESLEEAAKREAFEETSLHIQLVEQFYAYSRPDRDPRFHVVSIVFIADGDGNLKGSDDAKKAFVFFEDTLPQNIVFDHETILKDYFKYVKFNLRPRISP